MSLLPFCQWLAETEWSIALHESLWGYPLLESAHVWTLALFVGFATLLDLRLLGLVFRQVPVSTVLKRLMPWTVAGFVVMVITGLLLFYAIPVRSYQNVFFRLKLILLVLAGLNAFVFHRGVWKSVAKWDNDLRTPKSARRAGLFSLVLWAVIIFAGRMIAYNWFDCDRQPQPGWVNVAAGCVVEPEG